MKNVTLYLKLACVFNLSVVAHTILKVIERCFTNVIETENFLQLNVRLVKKILSSSELHITSELEVFNAVQDWINFDTDGRRKFARHLLSAVRLPLLSDPALEHLLRSSVCKNDSGCASLVRSVLLDRNKHCRKNVDIRHCSQSSFEIFLSSRNRKLKQVGSGENFQNFKFSCLVEKNEKIYRAVVVGGEIYVVARKLAGSNKRTLVIKKLWSAFEKWETVAELDYRRRFAVCQFASHLYIVGGIKSGQLCADSLSFDTKLERVRVVSGLKVASYNPACAAFDGKIVACGGFVPEGQVEGIYRCSERVEAFDHVGGSWSPMPSMTRSYNDHCSVAVKSKLFVIGLCDQPCEVFDKFTNSFSVIASSFIIENSYSRDVPGAVLMGKKIVIFGREENTIVFYDVEKDEWHQESCEYINGMMYKSCVKIAHI